MREHHVQCLLMGGQACVFYGAAEFSRDTDLAILADDPNLSRLKSALDALQAELIAVPNFDPAHFHTGHSIHFRCKHPEAQLRSNRFLVPGALDSQLADRLRSNLA